MRERSSTSQEPSRKTQEKASLGETGIVVSFPEAAQVRMLPLSILINSVCLIDVIFKSLKNSFRRIKIPSIKYYTLLSLFLF